VVSRVRRRVSIRSASSASPNPEQQPTAGRHRRADLAPNDRRLLPDLLATAGRIVNFVCGGVLSELLQLAVCRLVLLFEGVALAVAIHAGPWLELRAPSSGLERGRQVVCLLHEWANVCCRFSVAGLGQRGLDLRA